MKTARAQTDSEQTADSEQTGSDPTADSERAGGQRAGADPAPEPAGHAASQRGYTSAKDDYLARLRRVEGQVRGLQRMVAEDKYCIDVLTQVSAATRALQSVALGLLSDHLAHCVTQAAADGGPAAQEKLQEATAAIARLVRS